MDFRPKNLIFDFDGVLVDSEFLASQAEVKIKTKHGLKITLEEQIQKFTGCSITHPDVLEELKRLPADFMDQVDAYLKNLYIAELKPIVGVTETLEKLTLPKAVASMSLRDSLHWKLKHTRLEKYFHMDHLFSGDMVKNPKPAPDIYRLVLKNLNWKSDQTLVIEDSEHGTRAAKSAGLRVCGFLGGKHILPGHDQKLKRAGADFLISEMKQLLERV